ncbi:purple acid phosphatase family protein [Flexithrix dorotheae]|uniref:purple acid phosphatase family protein n=1 Tax=Flexithrix dorotheae TaxID=70993 RepID=UPI00035C39C9|nr:metallophosphoesterase family protein [Flexithrix dorotheae]
MIIRRFIFPLFVCLFIPAILFSQSEEILVKPFLQDATPNSIKIKWETSVGEESIVEFGKTSKLGKVATGNAQSINYTASRIHEVELTGLEKFTLYYYRVKTGKLTSDIYQFKTPPFATDGESFRLVAMSDMQNDHKYPDKFEELINDGVLSFLKKEYGGMLPENLALMMVPGDLVDRGTVYEQWKRDFFDPGSNLFSNVPVYPVPGNHERNSQFFFKYFSLPANGTPAYDGHWWYKDYGNIRIIGLDSNEEYHLQDQKDWLDKILKTTAQDPNIDFVFAQLHHPFKSEFWLDGEEDFTGEIVKKLETFSSESGKPSIHFFGHTHAYSRGQSRDHKHLWINVATSGGDIDYWGEYEQRNYEEFTVSQDEYGFVMVDIDPNNGDPKMTVKRYSRGNELKLRDNELRDSLTVWRFDKSPLAPEAISPEKGKKIANREIVLKANSFKSDFVGAAHGASHWQVATDQEFKNLAVDSWKQFEDWFYYENQQKNDDLTDEKIMYLAPGKTYYWRVRYRDKSLNWSDWSTVMDFTTEE